jgi:hypothetical protein
MKALLLSLDGAGLADAHAGNAVTKETMPTLFGAMANTASAPVPRHPWVSMRAG